MHRSLFLVILASVVATAILGGFSVAQELSGSKEIGRTTEKELKVVLSSSFGTIYLSRGESEKVLDAQSNAKPGDNPRMNVDYSIRGRVGYMDVTLGEASHDAEKKKSGFKITAFESGTWNLKFSDAIPISFDIQLGVGKGDFDLTGMQVKDLNLSTGASEVSLDFNEPNKTVIENISIESGVSKFDGHNLGNAHFKRFRFQGGVGVYLLDFNGNLENEVDVDAQVGLGILTIIIPPDVGARIFYEKSWISSLDCDRDFHSSAENEYTSENYTDASGKMNIKVDPGMGSIKVRHR